MIQTQFNVLYICEIKFTKAKVGKHIINNMQEKISKLITPKGFSIRPVLIHVNGVTEELEAERYFSDIIDFGRFLK